MSEAIDTCSDADCACYDRLSAALDRFTEAHYWIHMLEKHYHEADQFRWHVNVFLKAIKEVPDLIGMALQNDPGFPDWYKPVRHDLNSDPLLSKLSKNRDFVVHRGMLKLGSGGTVGITEGRGIKLGISLPIDALEDSDTAMQRYLWVVCDKGDFFGFLNEDEDSLPCVERTWRIPEMEGELIDLCATAWQRTGRTINLVIAKLGAQPLPLSLSCRHSPNDVRFKLYNRAKLREQLEAIRRKASRHDSVDSQAP